MSEASSAAATGSAGLSASDIEDHTKALELYRKKANDKKDLEAKYVYMCICYV